MSDWKIYTISEACKRFSSGKGITASQIFEIGAYPVFGGNGIRGYTDAYNFEGECAIIGRQGAYCGNTKYFCGKAYMTEHAIVATANDEHNIGYIANLLSIIRKLYYQFQDSLKAADIVAQLDGFWSGNLSAWAVEQTEAGTQEPDISDLSRYLQRRFAEAFGDVLPQQGQEPGAATDSSDIGLTDQPV